jgi:hypothetical protein
MNDLGKLSKLIDGRIPPHTECPFRNRCGFAENNTCHHKGVEHVVAYSCGAARAYDLITRNSQRERND